MRRSSDRAGGACRLELRRQSAGSGELADCCGVIFVLGDEVGHRGLGEVAALGGLPLVVPVDELTAMLGEAARSLSTLASGP